MKKLRIFNKEKDLRLCQVDGEAGYFHKWEEYSEMIPPSLLRGGSQGGSISRVFGIVEFEKCVRRVAPEDIDFIDGINSELFQYNKHLKEFYK